MRNSTFFGPRALFFSLFFIGFSQLLFSQTFNGQGNMLVPPGAPSQTMGITQSPCAVSGIGVLGGCNQIDHIDINLNHTWDGDIALFLIGPGGQVLELSSGNGGAGDNFTNTVFTDNTGAFITSGSPPFTGTFRPEGRQQSTTPPFPNTNPLGTWTFANTFNGSNADGEWYFMVNDYVGADWGEIISWSITFAGGGTAPTVTIGVAPSPICAGQPATLTLTFSQPTPPGVSYDGLINISTGSSILLNDIVPTGLTWTIPVLPTYTWTFTLASITSNGGCQPIIGTPSSATVVVNPAPVASISGDLSICTGESTTLTASGGGTYAWSNGATLSSITVSPAATQSYSVTVTNNGCSASATATVVVSASQSVAISLDVPAICAGLASTLWLTFNQPTPPGVSYDVQINSSTGPPIILNDIVPNGLLWSMNVSPTSSTTYILVSITSNGGCPPAIAPPGTATVVVNPSPMPSISGNLNICAGQSTALTASDGGVSNPTYLWSTGATTPSINVSTSGTYTVTVTKNGCPGTASATVNVAPPVSIGITGPSTICGTQAIILTATGNTSNIVWSTGATTTAISVSTVGTYSVTATDADGCTGVASETITLAPGPVVTLSAPISPICAGEVGIIVLTFSTPTPPGVDYNGLISVSNGQYTILNDIVPSGLTFTITYSPPATTLTYTLSLIGSTGNCPLIGSPNSATIVVIPTPSPAISGNLNPCDGQSTTLTSTAGGATNPTYSWSTGESTPSITVSSSGTYTVTVTKNGCSGTTSATVDVAPPPPISVSGGGSFCGISSTSLEVVGNFTGYLWTTGATTATINVTASGTYSVTATDANGCTATSQATVTFSPNPTANAGPNKTICDGQTTTLTATGGGNYAWSNGQTGPIISVNPNATTDFTVTVTNAEGCTATDAATVFVNPPPALSTTVNGPICEGSQATLTASGAGSFSWNTGQNTAIITVSPPVSTLFSVTLTDGNGCTNSDDIQVIVNPIPTANAGPDVNLCSGLTTVLTASGGSDFVWSNGLNGSVIDVNPTSTTTFSVTVSENGCSSADAVQVTVLPSPTAVPGPDIDICGGESAIISASGGTSYFWNTGQSGPTISVNPPATTTFQVTVSAANGCTDETAVEVFVTPSPTANAGPDLSICEGETANLNGSGGGNYAWSNGPTTAANAVSPVVSTVYSLSVSQNGCTDLDEVAVIVSPLPTANAGPNQSISSGQSANLTATGGGNYAWSNGQSGASISVSPTVTTTFSVTVTNTAGCTAVDEITVFVDELFTPDLGPDQTICLGQTATLAAAATTPPNTTILWSTGQTTPQITVSPANTANFSVTLTNSTGQTTTDEMTVFVNQLPIGPASIAGQGAICANLDGFYSIQPVSGATSYFWQIGSPATLVSGQGTTSVQVNFPPGASPIPVSVLAQNGCGESPATAISVQVIQPPPAPSFISGDLAPCASTVVDYQILPVSGAAVYNWQISGGGFITVGQGTISVSVNWNNSPGGTICVAAQNGCFTGQPTCTTVQTTPQPSANAGPDAATCLSTTNLAASGNGSWTQISGPATLTLSNQTDPAASVTSTQSGIYSLEWTVGSGICLAKDTLNLTFQEAPAVSLLTENCNPTNTGYTVNLTLAAGTAPYFIDGNSVGNGPFSSLEIPSGGAYSFLLTDANGCPAPLISGENTCNCSTLPGQMQLLAQNSCVGDSLHATFLGGGNFDADDVLGFALHTGAAPAGILAVSKTPDFGWQAGLAAGQTVFISAIIGSNNGAGLPDLTDPCLGISAGVPITIRALPTANLTASAPAVCLGDCFDLQFNFSGNGPFSIIFNENGQQTSLANLPQNAIQNICPTTLTNVQLVSVSDKFCENTASDAVQIQVGQPANASVATADQVCNTTTSGFPTTRNFSNYLLAGDATGTWADLSASGATGVFPNLDFNGVAPGFYTFEYTTAAATAPCLNQKYQLQIEVTATCTCPPVAILPPPTICNLPGSGFNLTDLVVPGSAPGSWSISNLQTGWSAQISGDFFDPFFTPGGQYELTYTLLTPPSGTCAAAASVVFDIEAAPSSGQSTSPLTLCEKENLGQPIDLFSLLENEDAGGSWEETSAILSQNGAFSAVNGQFSPEKQLPAAYFFEYAVPATAICPAAATTVEVLILPGPEANAGPDQTLTCSKASVILGAAQPGVNFKWTKPDGSAGPTTATYSVSQTGLFIVEVSNFFGCKTRDSVIVLEDKNLPTAIISAASAVLTCSNPTTVLDGNLSSPAGLNVEWILNGATVGSQPNLTVSTSGCFVLRVQNPANGCVDTASICIGSDQLPPQIQLSPAPTLTCKQDSATLWALLSQVGQPQILWTTANGSIVSSPNSPQIVVDAPGFYTISVANLLNGCTNSAGLTVNENVVPPVAIASTLNDLTCKQPTAELSGAGSSGSPNLLFEWSGGVILSGANSPTATVGAAGNYLLTVENPQNGCTASDETTVISIGQTGFPVSISSRPPTCPGDCDGSLTVENQQISGLEFSFSGNDFSKDTVWMNLCAGNFSLKIKDANGCEWDSTRTLLDPPQIFVELGPDATVQLGDSLLIEAFFSQWAVDLNWSPAPPNCTGLCPKFWFSPLEPTIFNIVATDANGCTASDSQKISVENADDVYVPNAFRPQASTGSSQFFTVFAGPSVRKVQLLQVYSRWGELVFQQLDFQPNVPESGWNGRLRGNWMNPGVFVWRAKIEYADGRTRELSGDLTVF